jgi:hypothetical protein
VVAGSLWPPYLGLILFFKIGNERNIVEASNILTIVKNRLEMKKL